jgi:hypothetical protein
MNLPNCFAPNSMVNQKIFLNESKILNKKLFRNHFKNFAINLLCKKV